MALEDWSVPRQSNLPEPAPKIFEERSLACRSRDLRRPEQLGDIMKNRRNDALQEFLLGLIRAKLLKKCKVERVEIGLRRNALDNEVVSEPPEVLLVKERRNILDLGLKV